LKELFDRKVLHRFERRHPGVFWTALVQKRFEALRFILSWKSRRAPSSARPICGSAPNLRHLHAYLGKTDTSRVCATTMKKCWPIFSRDVLQKLRNRRPRMGTPMSPPASRPNDPRSETVRLQRNLDTSRTVGAVFFENLIHCQSRFAGRYFSRKGREFHKLGSWILFL